MGRAQNRARRWSLAGDRGRQPAAEPAEPPTEAGADPGDLMRGLVIADIDAAAAIAVRADGRMPGHPVERYELAWSAAAEYLCSTEGPAGRGDLVRAALEAMTAQAQADVSHHGVSSRHGGGAMSAPRFNIYWAPAPADSIEDRIDDSISLAQIWPRLSRREQDAITAVVICGDPRSAAAALGLPYGTLSRHLHEARTRFLRLWHEGEQPSRVWAGDRPTVRGTADVDRLRRMQASRRQRAKQAHNQAIRAWAAANGIPCRSHGRIPRALTVAYEAERGAA